MGVGPEALVRAARREGVSEERVLAVLGAVPRAAFVPPGEEDRAYLDRPVPIPHGQVTTQPSLVARILAALSLQGGERVLEVGTGYGYQTALLGRLARSVWSVERFPDLAETARMNLERQDAVNVRVVVADGTAGLPEHAPYDAVVVAAAFPEVPGPLRAQLAEGGRLVQPLGPGGAEEVVLFARKGGVLKRRAVICGAHFVRLYGEHGYAPPSL